MTSWFIRMYQQGAVPVNTWTVQNSNAYTTWVISTGGGTSTTTPQGSLFVRWGEVPERHEGNLLDEL